MPVWGNKVANIKHTQGNITIPLLTELVAETFDILVFVLAVAFVVEAATLHKPTTIMQTKMELFSEDVLILFSQVFILYQCK